MKIFIAAVLFATAIAVVAEATTPTNYNVTTSGISAFLVNGSPNPSLTLVRGRTYNFDVDAIGHLFDIKTARVIGTASRYDDGVIGQGVDSGTLTFTVPSSAPGTLFYQCEVHGPMGGTLNIVDRGVPGVMPVGLGLLAIAIGTLGARALRRRNA